MLTLILMQKKKKKLSTQLISVLSTSPNYYPAISLGSSFQLKIVYCNTLSFKDTWNYRCKHELPPPIHEAGILDYAYLSL